MKDINNLSNEFRARNEFTTYGWISDTFLFKRWRGKCNHKDIFFI